MSHTIFHSRQQQLESQTRAVDIETVRGRRIAARRQVLEAFSIPDTAEAPTSRPSTGVGEAGFGEVSGQTGRANPDVNAAAVGLIALSDFDISAAADTTLGLLGVASPLASLGFQFAVGTAAQFGAPVGSVRQGPLGSFSVNTPTGLKAGFSSSSLRGFDEPSINPEIAAAARQSARQSAERAGLGQSAPGTSRGDTRGDVSGLGQSAPGTATTDSRDQSGLSQTGPGGFGGGDTDSGGGGEVGAGGGIGL